MSLASIVESQRWAVIVCYSPLCYLRATSIRSHWRRRDVVCACAGESWMVGGGGQRPFVCSGRRHSHHCQRLLHRELEVAATYLMRPVETECSGELTRLFCSPPREDPTTGKRLTRVDSRCVVVACVDFQESVTTPTPEQRGELWACARSFDSLSKSVSGKGGVFRHKEAGTSEEREKSQDDCLAVRKAARADGLPSRIMHGRSRLVTAEVQAVLTERQATWEPEGARTVARRNVAA